jgi:hypothetical protein
MRFGFRFFYKPEPAAWLLRHHTGRDEPLTSQASPQDTSSRPAAVEL